MSQTDDIHESFYDLFNQRFRRIDDPQQGPRYYTNIAIGAHLRPCRVHPNFQCVVVVKKSEVKDTPAPFLNRFEKYCITHSTLLDTALTPLPPCLKRVVLAAKEKVYTCTCGRENVVCRGLESHPRQLYTCSSVFSLKITDCSWVCLALYHLYTCIGIHVLWPLFPGLCKV